MQTSIFRSVATPLKTERRGCEAARPSYEESIANTLKEQCSKKLLTPLFAQNLFPLPNGKDTYDVKDAYVPDNNVQLLGNIYETIV
jgi:hypothetical protein